VINSILDAISHRLATIHPLQTPDRRRRTNDTSCHRRSTV